MILSFKISILGESYKFFNRILKFILNFIAELRVGKIKLFICSIYVPLIL